MTVFTKILGGVALLLLACALICGLWIRVHPDQDMLFHFRLSLAALCTAAVAIVLFMFQK